MRRPARWWMWPTACAPPPPTWRCCTPRTCSPACRPASARSATWPTSALAPQPRRKPRGQPRPAAEVAYNRAFARRRVVVEHTIGRLRRYDALTRTDRHRRRGYTARIRAVAGLVNRQLRHRA